MDRNAAHTELLGITQIMMGIRSCQNLTMKYIQKINLYLSVPGQLMLDSFKDKGEDSKIVYEYDKNK